VSRIGRKPISLPKDVEFKMEGNVVTIKGAKGSLTQEIPSDITVELEDGQLMVSRPSDNKQHRAFHGLSRALIANMVEGVTNDLKRNWNW
jgi:large subunit ribosomal protein L6